MKRKGEMYLLSAAMAGSIFLLPFAILKKSFKDWLIVYLVSILGNSFADRFLVEKGLLQYKTRPFPRTFIINFPFDYFVYPLLLLYYNQSTLNSRPLIMLAKLFLFVIPQVLLEEYLEKNTNLIKWKSGWKWYHSFISLCFKFLLCRMTIGAVRKINTKNVSV